MSLASPNDRSRTSADVEIPRVADDAQPRGEHPKSLRTFIYDVFAGRPRGVADATDAEDLRTDSPHARATSAPAATAAETPVANGLLEAGNGQRAVLAKDMPSSPTADSGKFTALPANLLRD